MIVLLSSAAKIVSYLHRFGKEYVGIAELHGEVPDRDVLRAVDLFTGEIYQRPPLRSSVSRRLRVRTVYEFAVSEFQGRRFLFRVRTESGTYIRKIVHDLGLYLGIGAHMVELRRTSDGPFLESSSFNVLQLAAAAHKYFDENDPSLLTNIVQPVERVISDFNSVYIKDSAVAAICHGASLSVGGIAKLEVPVSKGEVMAIRSLKGELIAMGRNLMDSDSMLSCTEGIAVRTESVVMDRNLYPKQWL